MIRKGLVFGGLLLVLAVTNLEIVRKEHVLRRGTTMLLELAPVDPRSLMQGDYMRLNYALARELPTQDAWPRDGQLVVVADGDGVARFIRRHEAGVMLGPGERLLRYRVRDGRFNVGTDAFFFQEGYADRYARARYGELRVDDSGTALLVGLRDAERRPLGEETAAR